MPRPLTLLHVQGMAERGGSDVALLRMLQALPPAEFRCHVAVPAPHPLAAEMRAAGARLHVVPMRRISTDHGRLGWALYVLVWPVTVLRLTWLVLRHRVSVVHTNSLHFWTGWAAAWLTRRPHVWHAREIVTQSPLAMRVERVLTARFATRVVAVSTAVAAQLDGAPVEVVLEYPDPAELHPGLAGHARARLGLDDTVPLAGFVGRLDTWKGVEVLLEAWPAVRAAVPTAELVVVGVPVQGKAAEAARWERDAGALAGVHWLGPRSDVPEVMADLDVLVAPSTTPEPYGLVLVEALAAGCPVVSTDQGGPPDIVAAAVPGAGRLVPPRDAAALAAAVSATLLARAAHDAAGRRDRPVLSRPGPSRYPALFAEVAAAGR